MKPRFAIAFGLIFGIEIDSVGGATPPYKGGACIVGDLTCTQEVTRIRVRWSSPPSGCSEKILVQLFCGGVGTSSVVLPGTQTEVIIDGCQQQPCQESMVVIFCILADETLADEPVSCVVPCPSSRRLFRRGDANASGAVDVADAIFMLSHLFARGKAPSCMDAGDANDDGQLNIGDPVAILAHLFARAGPLPSPFSRCGIDPITSPDLLDCAVFPPCP